jgi:hypothetical protein
MKKLLIGTALLFAALPFTFDGVTPTISKAHAVVGRPLTPGSFAGVHRRAMRRTYGLGWRRGVGHPVARAAAIGAATAATGWGGGWGWGRGWGWGGGYGGLYGYAGGPGVAVAGGAPLIGAAFCYPTFNYSTGWNEFCPGSGFAFGTGSSHQ